MGYRKIYNLYKDTTILQEEELYALEKVHGTSAHIAWDDEKIRFFSGGVSHEAFVELFNEKELIEIFTEFCGNTEKCILYGEAHGGKLQGMRKTYGEDLKFIVFEVKINEEWMSVDVANQIATEIFNLDFVPYEKGPATLEWVDKQRDAPSVVAEWAGCGDKIREGVVLRPILEKRDKRGNRIIAKHKRNEFMETRTPREVDPAKIKMLEDAKEVAEEWVTEMRLNHILDKLGNHEKEWCMSDTPQVIRALLQDIKDESENEIKWSKEVNRQIGKLAAQLYKAHISRIEKP